MATRQESIDAAIKAHEQWKARLEGVASSGTSDLDPTTVRKDDQCAFGKWLHDEVGAADREHPIYQRVCGYHAAFHGTAADVLELSLKGERIKASVALGFGGQFAKQSTLLESVLREWRGLP